MERRTVQQWVHFLEDPGAELTLSEFMALCLLHIRENMKDTRLGTQHLEGMVGTFDEFLNVSNKSYKSIAARRTRPTPISPGSDDETTRAALHLLEDGRAVDPRGTAQQTPLQSNGTGDRTPRTTFEADSLERGSASGR